MEALHHTYPNLVACWEHYVASKRIFWCLGFLHLSVTGLPLFILPGTPITREELCMSFSQATGSYVPRDIRSSFFWSRLSATVMAPNLVIYPLIAIPPVNIGLHFYARWRVGAALLRSL